MKKTLLFSLALLLIPAFSLASDNSKVEKEKKEYSVKLNDRFDITLPSNPSTGYSWVIYKIPNQVVLIDMSYKEDENPKHFVGAGGNTTFTFRAIKKGNGIFVVKYARPWENLDEPKIVKTIKVR